jgi:tetratricopeptide (TPR) repeat protein
MPLLKWTILIIFILLEGSALAEDATSLRARLVKPTLSADDLVYVFIQAEDNPKQFLLNLADLWNQTDAMTDGLLKARIGWMIGRFANYEEIPDFKVRASLRQALEIIKQQNLPIPSQEMLYFIAYTDLRSEDQKEQLEQIQKLIGLANQIENPDTRAFAYTQLIFESVNSGINNQRVPFLIDEVVKLIPLDQNWVSPIHIGTLGDLSAVLATIGQEAQAETIYRRIDTACKEQSMRVFCAIRAYNRATLLLKKEERAKAEEAIQLFDSSLQLSLEVEDWVMQAKNQYGLSRVYNQIGRYAEALEYGQKAASFLQQNLMDDWAALSLAQVAKAYLGLQDPAKSALIGDAALKLCPPNIESIVTEIHLVLARSHEALGQFDHALKHFQQYMEGERKIRTDDAHKRYMKLRDHSLSKENEFQAHQIALLKNFRMVSFQPLLNNQQLIDRYLVAIRDLTAIKAIERQAQEQMLHVNELQGKLAEILKGSLSDIKQLIQSIELNHSTMLQSLMLKSESQSVQRQLHTWKGLARTLGLKALSTSIHDLESDLKMAGDIHDLPAMWEKLAKSLADYQYILKTVLVATDGQSGRSKTLYDYGTAFATDMSARLQAQDCPMEGLIICDQVQSWNQNELTRLHHILVHVLNNAVDHGFIRPKMRHIKVRAALIHITARRVDETVAIEVADNGVGVDWTKVFDKARAMGIEWESRADPSHLLFLDGMSTAESASETSGRGVGLGAVKELCEEMSGQITIGDSHGGGTKVVILIPAAIALKSAPINGSLVA